MKKILGAAVGSCVHTAGILNFLNIAKNSGFKTTFVGCSVDVDELKKAIREFRPDIAGISYRLSPESAVGLFEQINREIISREKKTIFVLGTTGSVSEALRAAGLLGGFSKVFTGGESAESVEKFLYDRKLESLEDRILPQNLLERMEFKRPFPLIRHHFGRPGLEETEEGIKEISDASAVDIVSLGPDQNAQEFFFEPQKMNRLQDGAGGVPVRSASDLRRLFKASRRGNWPIMRCYSGTNNIIKFAEILLDSINNAWCAVPLCWYNELDGRSTRTLEDAVEENIRAVKWHADRGVPVEINESHHWSLRYSHDAVAVASAYLAAHNAKKAGVKTYISQYMFNTPPETSFSMDLAKMLAKVEMIESLHDSSFKSLRQTRCGLYSMPPDFNKGKGQLASSTFLQMQLNPSIIHVVAYCESSYAAKPDDIIESCSIVNKVIENCLNGVPDMKNDRVVIKRKDMLVHEAGMIIDKIKSLQKYAGRNFFEKSGDDDPLSNPEVIAYAVRTGVLDAPFLQFGGCELGRVRTMFVNGANYAADNGGNILPEDERLSRIRP